MRIFRHIAVFHTPGLSTVRTNSDRLYDTRQRSQQYNLLLMAEDEYLHRHIGVVQTPVHGAILIETSQGTCINPTDIYSGNQKHKRTFKILCQVQLLASSLMIAKVVYKCLSFLLVTWTRNQHLLNTSCNVNANTTSLRWDEMRWTVACCTTYL